MQRTIRFVMALSAFLLVMSARAQVLVLDELGRLENPTEAFYTRNPPSPGQPRQPIAEVNAYDGSGQTPLIKAVQNRNQAEVIRLLDRKANPNLFSAAGRTALEFAARNNDLAMVRLLLKRGAKADRGYPLTHAKDPEIIALLKQHGAVERASPPKVVRIALFDREDVKVLQNALAEEKQSGQMNPSIPLAVMFQRTTAEIGKLLEEGSNINEVHPRFGTALHIAIEQRRDSALMLFLLESGADANLPWRDSLPLFNAIAAMRVDWVDILLRHGARVDARSRRGDTPLHLTVNKGSVPITERLIRAGADVQARDEEGRTPLHLAADKGNTEIAKALIQAGADVQARDKEGRTPLHHTAYRGRAKMVKPLTQAGADVQVRGKDGRTPLHYAAHGGYAETVKQLILAGADVQAQDDKGKTALHYAADRDHPETVKQLVLGGADVQMQDDKGRTALHYAVRRGIKVKVVKQLISAGADVQARDNEGKTPRYYAEQYGSLVIIQLLEQASRP
ncbi:MAG: ankyrin repeat domain-containing protein [Burkholderiaceae bacterium]|nr:ankyrin repeat domain-containing protein [Burkholderiaceae bacterium]